MKDLKTLRAESGLSLHKLAAKSGVDYSFIHDIENHRAAMSENAAAGLAGALGVNKDALRQVQTLAHFNHQAGKLQGLDNIALKKAALKDTGKTAAAVMALTEFINDESLPVELRQQASKTISKLLDLLPGQAAGTQKSQSQPEPDPDRDAFGRKRPGKKITRDELGRAR